MSLTAHSLMLMGIVIMQTLQKSKKHSCTLVLNDLPWTKKYKIYYFMMTRNDKRGGAAQAITGW